MGLHWRPQLSATTADSVPAPPSGTAAQLLPQPGHLFAAEPPAEPAAQGLVQASTPSRAADGMVAVHFSAAAAAEAAVREQQSAASQSIACCSSPDASQVRP